ncbi:MAG: hypothetical protein WA702_09640 [Bradyrhizobium sp.]|uniref:YfhO family protein n=1 Tax=Bradyrhizobium sp. TaxID=376 RepID=UPI003C7AB094
MNFSFITRCREPASRLAILIGLVTTVWLGAVSRWIIRDAVVPWDSKNQFYAFFRFLNATLRAGEWPFWNPYHYGGHPSVADPQSLVFAPVFVAWGMLDPAPTMRAFDLVIFAHLLAGGIAIAIMGWRARWPIPASVLAATLFMFGGAASGRLQHSGIILSYSLLPVALLLLQLALERRSFSSAIGFAITAAGIALGRNQTALLLCLFLVAAALAEIMSSPQPMRFLRERSTVLMTMTLAGGALLIIPMLLTLQFAQLSNRPAESLDDALRGSLYPANLATLMVANIFGTHGHYWGPGATTLTEVALTDDSENYLFFGVVPILLLLWFGIVGGGVWRRGRRLMMCTLAVACLFMLGRYTPFYELAFRFVPGIDLFRRPADASFLFGIALALLVGHSLADYVRDGPPPFRPLMSGLAASALTAVVGSAVVFSARTGHALDAIRETAIASAVLLVAVLILLSARRRPVRMVAATLLALVGVAELLWWNTASRLNAESHSNYAVLETPTGAEADAIASLENAIAADHQRGARPRVEVLGLGGAWQNLAMVRGWEAINGYNPLRIGLYDRLVSPGEENWGAFHRQFPPSFDNYDSALARALGLTYLVMGQPLDKLPNLKAPPAAELLLPGPPIWIYRLAGAMPRAVIYRWSASDAAGAMPSRSGNLSSIDTSTADDRLISLPPSEDSAVVKIESYRPDRVELVTTSAAAGLLVLHDLYYPGWIAEVDGRPAPMLRAALLFRSVVVPAGRHRVAFRFRPFTLSNLGAAVTGSGRRDIAAKANVAPD